MINSFILETENTLLIQNRLMKSLLGPSIDL